MSAASAEAPRAAVSGYVEAVTATAVLGWAWIPGQSQRLPMELHIDGQTISRATANLPREDLARGGVGDGAHAFSLPVPETLRDRLAELRVVVRGQDGTVVPLGSPPPSGGIVEHLVRLGKGMEAMAASQRVLHRNLQAVLVSPPAGTAREQAGSAGAAIAAAQAALRDDIAALELFVIRLEQKPGGSSPLPARSAGPRWTAGAIVVSLAALGLSAWALALAMPG